MNGQMTSIFFNRCNPNIMTPVECFNNPCTIQYTESCRSSAILPFADVVISFVMLYRKRKRVASIKKNPLTNRRVMGRLNPYALVQKKAAKEVENQRKKARQAKLDAARGVREL